MKPFPSALEARLREILGEDYASVRAAFAHGHAASFRANALKDDASGVEAMLRSGGFPVFPVPEIPGAYALPREDEYRFKGSAIFREGHVYMQSLASLLPPLALAPQAGSQVLDVCAAPGSKTTQMAAMMGNRGRIVALEQSPVRFEKLVHNCRLQGAKIVEAVRADARGFLAKEEDLFDFVLLDAPCSAEGRIRLDDERTYAFFSLANIRRKAELQSELLRASYARLAPGGTLVYSTCTFAPEENEGVVAGLLAESADAEIVPLSFGIPEERPGLAGFRDTAYPSALGGTRRVLASDRFEGFFVAKVRKRA